MTDERIADDALIAATCRLPRGSGIVFRHYATPPKARTALFERLRAVAVRRDLTLIVAGASAGYQADGRHVGARACVNRRWPGELLTVAAHDPREVAHANRMNADLIFLSPVFATRSHPGAASLGPMRFAALARLSRAPVIALGGMTPKRFHRLTPLGAYGWAAIDALAPSAT